MELREYSTNFCVEDETCCSIKLLYTYENSLLTVFYLCIYIYIYIYIYISAVKHVHEFTDNIR
jgi:hypothetical protein